MKTRKRVLSLALALVTALALLPAPALAANIDFIIRDGVLIKYIGPGGDVVIPFGVTSIGDGAFLKVLSSGEGVFYEYTNLTSITIPSSVTSIGEEAFSNCAALTSVTIPNSVTSIGDSAFRGCPDLANVTIPSSVTSIGKWAFAFCAALTSVTIPNSVTAIGSFTFYGCESLASVTIPDSVTSIGEESFHGCTSLTGVTIPNSVTSIGGWAFFGCNSLKDVYYSGTEAQWKAISFDVDAGNECLASATIHYNSPMPKPTAPIVIVSTGIDPESSGTAVAMTQKVQVGDQTVELQTYALTANGGVTNYVKLRDLADILDGTAAQFNVTWSKEAGVGLETGTPYTSRNGTEGVTNYSGDQFYQRGASTTNVDGVAVSLQCFALQNGAYTYYKLRDLGQALNFNVGWSQERGVFIEPDRPYDPDN